MEWPALSPDDLNTQESVWCILSRGAYAYDWQLESVAELKDAIIETRDNIDAAVLQGKWYATSCIPSHI